MWPPQDVSILQLLSIQTPRRALPIMKPASTMGSSCASEESRHVFS